jgi:hypothetical protein
MKITQIRTNYHAEGTLGKWIYNGKRLCFTLERPENGNKPDNKQTPQNDAGCIPEGIYKVKKDHTGKFQYFAIQNVPNRSAIEIHPANSIDDLLGCVGLGEEIKSNVASYKGKYKFWLTNSKATCQKMMAELPEEFDLEITSDRTLCSVKSIL